MHFREDSWATDVRETEKHKYDEGEKEKGLARKALTLSREQNIIYVGRKPPMSYVLGIITSFTGSNTKEVTLKARGRSITTAIDAVEIARHRFMKDLSVGKITIGTEEIPLEEGGTRAVSTIEITLTRE